MHILSAARALSQPPQGISASCWPPFSLGMRKLQVQRLRVHMGLSCPRLGSSPLVPPTSPPAGSPSLSLPAARAKGEQSLGSGEQCWKGDTVVVTSAAE